MTFFANEHDQAAIAAAISLRSYLLVTFRSKGRRTVSLKFPDIDLDHTWRIDDLPWSTFSQKGKKKFYYDLVTSLDPEFIEALQPHIAQVSTDKSESIRKIHHASALCFLYLFLSLGSSKSPPCIYTLRSTIPIGAGLGSSASISVCLASALMLQIRALSGPHQDQPSEESALQIERINRWAFVGEMCIHGNPSGVDNTVSAGGKAVLFQRKDYNRPPEVRSLRSFPELPLLLVNTRQSRSTAVEVAKVGRLREKHPQIAAHILDAIDRCTKSAHDLITREDFDAEDHGSLKTLGELITVNHGLLVALGVSHPKLERIREIIDHAGIGWTKLTGAGGGGCAITILKPPSLLEEEQAEKDSAVKPASSHLQPARPSRKDRNHPPPSPIQASNPETLAKLETKLQAEGFDIFTTTLAGDGVGVLWPAVLAHPQLPSYPGTPVAPSKNGDDGDDEGIEIDQEKFLNAEGNAGIEALVGVIGGTGGASSEGWRFWRP